MMTNPSSSSSRQSPEWELRKENAAPLARGRDAAALSRALAANPNPAGSEEGDGTGPDEEERGRVRSHERLVRPSELAAELLQERQEEGMGRERSGAGDGTGKREGAGPPPANPLDLLAPADRAPCAPGGACGCGGTDPLIHWLGYVRSHRDARPSDSGGEFLLLERTVRALAPFPRYRDDVRFVRACVLYADRTSAPGDVFRFLHGEGIGSRTALFWVAWAWVAEKADDFKFAEKVFLKGIRKGARPARLLEERHKQFQRRMSRHWLNNTSLAEASIGGRRRQEEEEEEEEEGWRGVGGRGALAGLTEGGARRNHRAAGGQQGGGRRGRGGLGQQRAGAGAGAGAGKGEGNGVKAKGGFSIFVDENDENGPGGYDDLDRSRDGAGHGGRRRIETEADRIKENEGRKERWNERGGIQGEEEGQPSLRQPQQRPPSFAVFVDDQCAERIEREENEEEEELQRQRDRKGREDDGRSLRQKMDCGVAGRLQRDPLRYMRNPSKQSSDRAKYGDDLAKSAKKSSRRGHDGSATKKRSDGRAELPCGFDKSLCRKGHDGQERCFEEARARARNYKLVPSDADINLLKAEEAPGMDKDDSSMDVDSSSVNDVEMDDDEQGDVSMASVPTPNVNASVHERSGFIASTLNRTGPISSSKPPMPKRVLFGLNNTVISHDPNDTSAASSTMNERDAVGVANMGKEEETINTKFALKELSMMFTSPGGDAESDGEDCDGGMAKPLFSLHTARKNRCNLTPASEASSVDETTNGDTATFSVVADLMCDNKGFRECSKSTEPFAIHEENNRHDHEENESVGQPATAGPFGGSATPLTIFKDPTSGQNDLDSAEKDNGNTARFSDLGDAFQDLVHDVGGKNERKTGEGGFQIFVDNEAEHESSIQPPNQATSGFSIFCDAENDEEGEEEVSPREHILDDVEGFGAGVTVDISRIAPASPDTTVSESLLPENAIDYASTHSQDEKYALRHLLSEGSRHMIDYRDKTLDRRLSHKVPKHTEIDLDYVTAKVQHELGRGANGVVLLCTSTDERRSFASDVHQSAVALKVQSPIGGLAWEYSILQIINRRVPKLDARRNGGRRHRRLSDSLSAAGDGRTALPFPQPFSFVAFENGGLLGMTAASNSGINLVDLVNFYRKSGEGQIQELVIIHYTARMLKHMESLHWHGKVMHCDVKPDNWVLMASTSACGTDSTALIQGADLMLVDFGRAVDLEAAAGKGGDHLAVRFHGNEAARDMECVAIRENLSWGLDIDTYGLCASVFTLLHGSHMNVEKDATTKRWRPHKPFRRYWNRDLWFNLFDTLLNMDGTNGALGSHPNSQRNIRTAFEEYLDEGNRRRHLESYLKHQASFLPKQK